jgi:small subunit ribosomal protein S7
MRSIKSKFIKKYLTKAFVGSITKNGKKSKASKIFNMFLFDISVKFEISPVEFLNQVIENVRPKVFLISKKISGSTVKIPTPISLSRSYSIAIKWFLSSAAKRSGSPFNQLIFFELLDIYSNPSNATLRKRDEYHKLAKINRPYLRYNRFL